MSNRLLRSESCGSCRRVRLRFEATSARPLSWDGVRAPGGVTAHGRSIAQLDSHMLKDIGVSLAEAEAEANKPFWRS